MKFLRMCQVLRPNYECFASKAHDKVLLRQIFISPPL